MKIISILSFKGGTGKTITSANMADILSVVHKKRVLLIDADKQGNLSQYFSKFEEKKGKGTAEMLLEDNANIHEYICKTENKNIDIITSNMYLYQADRMLFDSDRDKFSILKRLLEKVKNEYDFCIIDNAPSVDIVTINSLVASDEVIITVRADNFSLKGIKELLEQIENAKHVNKKIKFKGCIITHYQNNDVNNQFITLLQNICKVFETVIRLNKNVAESTFYQKTIMKYNKRCGATIDYKKLVNEYLNIE
ncbi:TPA: ParA family protein [Clostridioides difficile]|uniref:Soj protein n=1 Tax=Clostridioides difficile TaxID=1496 RepID=A0A069AFP4_CLODI|nr:ParA family protein [Clostridioides difficile]AXU79251.1 Soj protein [Clostridioides difficile]EGT3760493.1 ParA family protein [Clostridioides difficile]EGT3769043.1 ParA family protein [Clostridioides difficile]EGT4111165.1 ParA family protein [Clostridioides difficile]EGT4517229.1 ParA family protein [Clostridioides difficile]